MANENALGAFGQAKELRQRILFTLGALIIYRLGTYVPIAGIDTNSLAEIMSSSQKGLLECLMSFLVVPYRGWQFLHSELCHTYLHQ